MRVILVILALCALLVGADAQEVQPWGSRDFSAKRIGVPPNGSKLGLVQIDPNEEQYHLTPARIPGTENQNEQTAPSLRDPDAPANWFWSAISPEIAAGSASRLPRAVGQLALSDRNLVPDWDHIAGLVESFGPMILRESNGTQVSPAFVLAVLATESGGRVNVTSDAGAQGLMQLMPATAQRFGVQDAFSPAQNIKGGVAYLGFLLRTFGQDPLLAIAAYNAGEGAIAKHGGVPPFAETRNYVPKVLGAWSVARLFCKTPPVSVTDPCEFSSANPDG